MNSGVTCLPPLTTSLDGLKPFPWKLQHFASCTFALPLWWIARFGIPVYTTSDIGTTFNSQLWTSLANLLGFSVNHTTSYNSSANRFIDRFYRILKKALMSCCKDSNWFAKFSWVLLVLRTTPKDALDIYAAGMVYDHPCKMFTSANSYNLLR
ncbi:uncharacterized protein [Palaemon carinicauda]|uniref:uncharacterized protein n=1 Tax=Palaemon carinicauda TaxID=392227 RepID=UPI0035B65E32